MRRCGSFWLHQTIFHLFLLSHYPNELIFQSLVKLLCVHFVNISYFHFNPISNCGYLTTKKNEITRKHPTENFLITTLWSLVFLTIYKGFVHILLLNFSQVLISGLSDNWPARKSWTTEQLSAKYGDAKFRLSQRSSQKITMKFKDYLSYMQIQHDEDPLYIFDEKVCCSNYLFRKQFESLLCWTTLEVLFFSLGILHLTYWRIILFPIYFKKTILTYWIARNDLLSDGS